MIPSDFTRLSDISPNIYHFLMNEQQYDVQSIVSDEVMRSFIDYLDKNINSNINSSNKIEYLQLSKEFNVMNNLIRFRTQLNTFYIILIFLITNQ